jgi:type I restriction enzyme M protein
MREVLEKFDFDNTISKLDEAGLLFQVLERFKNVDLHPDQIDNATMGTIFEELIRKFNEALNENPGEHFTPRDVVHLMADLMLAGDADRIRRKGIVCTVYDPCCGSGGMLTITRDHVTVGLRKNGDLLRPPMNPGAEIHLFGQEVNPETWAVSKSDLFMKDPTGRDADNIAYGSVLSSDRHAGRSFDYLIANPPYGKDWKRDEEAVETEHERGASGRFAPGLPRISDGQLLFLLHMLAHTKEPKEGGSRIAIIMNGSPLFTGDAGSGESEIRRYILEHDLLEALIALPEQLFYNTGIATYVWVVTNRKTRARKAKVQLIDATTFWVPMRKSLGDKRREIPLERAQDIGKLLAEFRDGETRRIAKDGKEEEAVVSRIFPTTHFGFRKITVERPLRLNFQATPERLARLDEEKGFQSLAQSRKREPPPPRKKPRAVRCRRRSARSSEGCRAPCSRTDPNSSACSTAPPARRACSSRRPPARRSSRRFPSATRPPRSAATPTATPSPTPSCATPRASRYPRATIPPMPTACRRACAPSSSARLRPTCPTPGSTPRSAIPRMAAWASSATRSTSTATSTATSRRAHSKRSRPTSGQSRATSCACWRR